MREIDDVGPGRTRDGSPGRGGEIGADAAGCRHRQHRDAGTVGGAVVRDRRERVELGSGDRDRGTVAEQKVLHVDDRRAAHIARGLKRVGIRTAIDQHVAAGRVHFIVASAAIQRIATTSDDPILARAAIHKVDAAAAV